MIFGHDYKYRLPEMDMLIGAAADMGIHFTSDQEGIHEREEGPFVVQTASVTTPEDVVIMLTVTKRNPEKREVTP